MHRRAVSPKFIGNLALRQFHRRGLCVPDKNLT
jgi:hypothetical protein